MTRSADDLSWAAHVSYSIVAIGEMPARGIAAAEADDEVAAQAFTEAFLGHARTLIEFVAGRPIRSGQPARARPHSNDITPADFVTGWALPQPAKYDVHLLDIDRHLAHLTKNRGTQGHAWDGYFTDLAAALLDDLDLLAGAIEQARNWPISRGLRIAIGIARTDLEATAGPWPEGLGRKG